MASTKKNIVRKIAKNGAPYYLDSKGKRVDSYSYLKQFSNKPRNLTSSESETFSKVKKNSRKGVHKGRIRIGGKFISKKLETSLKEFAANQNISVNDFIKQNEKDIEFYLENKAVFNSFISDKLISLIRTYKYKIDVHYSTYIKSREELIKLLLDFKKNLINRSGINVVETVYYTSIMERGNILKIDLRDLDSFMDASDEELQFIESEYIQLIFSSNKDKKKLNSTRV